MIHLDESLAKGLATRFFRDHNSALMATDRSLEKLYKNSRKGSARTIEKITSKFRVQKSHLLFYEGGKGYKKYMFRVVLSCGDRNPLKGWNEEALFAQVDCWNFKKLDQDHEFKDWIIFHISKHCIQRIIERNFNRGSGDISEIYKKEEIYSEIRSLILWSTIWSHLTVFLVEASQKEGEVFFEKVDTSLKNLSIFVPTENGVLMCNMEKGTLLARTYLHDEQLSENQIKFKQYLHGITHRYQFTELGIYKHIHDVLKPNEALGFSLVLRTLVNQILHYVSDNIEWFASDMTQEEKETILTLSISHFNLTAKTEDLNDLLTRHEFDKLIKLLKKQFSRIEHKKLKSKN